MDTMESTIVSMGLPMDQCTPWDTPSGVPQGNIGVMGYNMGCPMGVHRAHGASHGTPHGSMHQGNTWQSHGSIIMAVHGLPWYYHSSAVVSL